MSGSKLARYGDLTSEQKQGSEMTYSEIADMVGVSVKALKAHDLAVKQSANEIEAHKVEALERRCQ